MALRDDQRNEILQATDIVRLIGEQVALKPRGKEYIGLCPFHDDKNPSMYVSPVKQIYKCFSCGAGGSAYDFIMNYHKMGFVEALKFLADRAGIKLRMADGGRRMADGQSEGPTERELIADANTKAVSFFRGLLQHPEHGRVAREYIAQRGISSEMQAAFQIGCAADRWDGLLQMIQSKNWDARSFEMAGLISRRDNHPPSAIPHPTSCFDRLRHRLIFPIFDAIGRPIAFGGRKLRAEDEPKYLNCPETKLFNKSATLYGLHLAKKPIIDSKTAIIVEGYTDVIACHQAGVRNVVATLGTALTLQHIQTLHHFADKVVLIYDGDEAGQKAADRAVEIFLAGAMDVAFAVLPEGMDPDELFALADGMAQWNDAVEKATDVLEFQFRRVRAQLDAATTLTGRQRVAEEYLQRLAQLGIHQMPMIRRALVLPRLAQMLHLSEQAVQDLLKRMAPVKRANPVSSIDNAPDNDIDKSSPDIASASSGYKIKAFAQAERHLIGCLLREPKLFHQVLSGGGTLDETLTPTELLTGPGRRLYERVYQRLCDPPEAPEGIETTMQSFLADLAAEGESDLAALATHAESEAEEYTGNDAERLVQLLRSAADAILGHHRELEYERDKQALARTDGQSPVENDEIQSLRRRMFEHRKANPSPGRIARLGS